MSEVNIVQNRESLRKPDQETPLCLSGNPSIEALISKYLELENRIRSLKDEQESSSSQDPERQRIITFCEDKIREAKAAIFPECRAHRRRVFLAWRLLHRASEELILLMEPEELIPFGTRLKLELKMAPMPETHQVEWIGKLSFTMQKLEQSAGQSDGQGESVSGSAGTPPQTLGDCNFTKIAARQFKNIAKAVNDSVDDRFWDLWVQKLIALLYAGLLILGGILFFGKYYQGICQGDKEFCVASILLLGGSGGLVSGLLSGEKETIPKSHFWFPLSYYAVVRPLIGSVAALVLFWALQSEFLIKISPHPSGREISQLSGQPPTPPLTADAPQDSLSVSTITLRTVAGKEQYLLMIMLLFAGFSGDKLLKVVADRVTMRLIAEAEKTKKAS